MKKENGTETKVKRGSLEKWIVKLMVTGSSILCLILVVVCFFLYLHAVTRRYNAGRGVDEFIKLPMGDVIEEIIRFSIIFVPIIVLMVTLAVRVISIQLRNRVSIPLKELINAAMAYREQNAEDLAKGNKLFFTVPENVSDDEIGTLWETCEGMETSLKKSIRELKDITTDIERAKAEMAAASQIQLGMLPSDDSKVMERSEFSLKGSMRPARRVGGDFYDYFLIDDDHLALVIGDVSGKGMPASLFMVLSMTQIRMQATSYKSPAKILASANTGICKNNPEMLFVTVWMGILEISTGIMRACNAGHEDPFIMDEKGDYVLDITEHDIPLGIMEDMELTEYQRKFKPGDYLFVYTDGVAEATNDKDEAFTTDRVLSSLNADKKASCSSVLSNMQKAIDDFVKDSPQFDDITMLSFKYNGT